MAKKRGPRDWEVGAVLKDKLNSQGTLFRGGTKHSSDKRYPRGYTPERQQEVAEAVVRPDIRPMVNQATGERLVKTGTQSMFYKDRRVRGSGDMSDDSNMYWQSNQPTRDLVSNIARSTVPKQHLEGVQWRTGVGDDHLHRGVRSEGVTIAAHYDRAGDALSKGDPVIRVRGGQESNFTPIHEIGHHVSATVAQNDWRQSRLPQASGMEEGFADRYAFEHYRGEDKKPLTELREYPSGAYGMADDPGRSDAFSGGYHAVRGDIPTPDPMAKYGYIQEPSVTDTDNWKSWEQGQASLFNLSVSGPPGSREVVKFEPHAEDRVPWKGYKS